jgi:hypothetical protein
LEKLPAWVWILIALTTGGGGSIVGTKFRVDAFTGSEAKLMEQRIKHKIEKVEIERFLENHFDETHASWHLNNPTEGHPPTSVFKAYEE